MLALALSWLGFVLHNVADLPGQSLASPETLYPTLVYLVVLVVRFFASRAGSWLLLGWAALQLLGGGVLSVLPLPFLPFDPAQTWHHYSFHVVYVLSQVPLVVLTLRALRDR